MSLLAGLQVASDPSFDLPEYLYLPFLSFSPFIRHQTRIALNVTVVLKSYGAGSEIHLFDWARFPVANPN
jgi:hypothetical protein